MVTFLVLAASLLIRVLQQFTALKSTRFILSRLKHAGALCVVAEFNISLLKKIGTNIQRGLVDIARVRPTTSAKIRTASCIFSK